VAACERRVYLTRAWFTWVAADPALVPSVEGLPHIQARNRLRHGPVVADLLTAPAR